MSKQLQLNHWSKTIYFLFFLGSSLTLSSQNALVDQHLQNIANIEGLSTQDINGYIISNNHTSTRSQLSHYYLLQRVDDIEIYETQSSIHVRPDGTMFRYNNAFLPNAAQRVTVSSAAISHQEAIQSVIQNFGYDDSQLPIQLEDNGGREEARLFSPGSISQDDIPIKLVYCQNEAEELRLCYDLSINEADFTDWWSLKVDAVTGEIVDQVNWTVECNFEHDTNGHHVCKDELTCGKFNERKSGAAMTNSYNVFPEPVESPSHGTRAIINDPADPVASPFGWHDTNGSAGAEFTITRGNNVYAQEDQNGNNGTGFSPNGGSNLVFDYAIDFTMAPSVNRDASITNLFYWNNLTHDVWYQYGFDEASGNFQENNYGNGGNGSDSVNADGLDGSGTNNANFSTPPDGFNPRMQMFLWSPGSFLNTVINSPASISGNINGVGATYGASNFNVTGDLVLADDGSANPEEGCGTFTNSAAMTGNIALIDRGTCEFGTKSLNAQNAGAIAVVVCQNTTEAPFAMGGGVDGNQVTIPSIMISQSDCNTIKANTPGTNITFASVNNTVDIDGSFDNVIIGHEYGHGISIRLTGGASNANCLNNDEQMGEGWSDYVGLVMTIEPNDDGTPGRGVGTYAISQSPSGQGIRAFPYSTDLSVDPRTYNDIQGTNGPHAVGSVWCAMLWELTWALIDVHGFDPDLINGTGGNNLAMELVTEAFKLQACSPGFVDGRDAILDADLALNGGANECLIWAAFAKRGLGFGASQGSSNSRNDGVESFSVPTTCEVLDITKTVDKPSVIAGDTLTYTLTFDNQTSTDYTNLVMTDSILECLTYVTGSATNGATFANGIVELTGVVPARSVVSFSFQALVESNLNSNIVDFLDDAEGAENQWVLSNSFNPTEVWALDGANPFQGSNSWFAENTGNPNLKEMTLRIPSKITANSELRFWHLVSALDNFDGGFVEISIDNQTTWTDLGPNFTQNGYNNTFDVSTPVFGGLTNTAYIETIADLSSFEGENVFIRFSMIHTGNSEGTGWNIDDIEITNTEKTVSNIAQFTASPGINQSINIFPPTDVIAATCNDGIQNGTETGVDTGGNCGTATPCDFDIVISGSPTTGGIVQAQNLITSTAIITINTDYLANEILLENDFEVVLGTQFLAEINPCSAFNDDSEVALKVVSVGTNDNNKKQIVVDINIPITGKYALQFQQEDGKVFNIPKQEFAKGIHRVRLETEDSFVPTKIDVIER